MDWTIISSSQSLLDYFVLFPNFRLWAYLMTIIQETRRTHYIWYLYIQATLTCI